MILNFIPHFYAIPYIYFYELKQTKTTEIESWVYNLYIKAKIASAFRILCFILLFYVSPISFSFFLTFSTCTKDLKPFIMPVSCI